MKYSFYYNRINLNLPYLKVNQFENFRTSRTRAQSSRFEEKLHGLEKFFVFFAIKKDHRTSSCDLFYFIKSSKPISQATLSPADRYSQR
jgi:hypothetical protein